LPRVKEIPTSHKLTDEPDKFLQAQAQLPKYHDGGTQEKEVNFVCLPQ
jgi:hypothetical protein